MPIEENQPKKTRKRRGRQKSAAGPAARTTALQESFAKLVGKHTTSEEDAGEALSLDEQLVPDTKMIVEGLLFLGEGESEEGKPAEPLSIRRLATITETGLREVEEAIAELNQGYEARQSPLVIKLEGRGYRLILREEYSRLADRYHGRLRAARLTQPAVEVLALVAYRQPVSSEEIEDLRQTNSSALLRQLVRRKLLSLNDKDSSGVTTYRTTDRFLRLMKIESLGDLPLPEQIDRHA